MGTTNMINTNTTNHDQLKLKEQAEAILQEENQMIDLETVNKINHAPIAERIQIIELILESLKQDIHQLSRSKSPQFKPFKVRQFNLGRDVHVDRDIIYAERSF